MNNLFLEIKNLSKSYQLASNEINIFKNVSFKINKGDLVALVGPSGSGKSSLLNMISCLDDGFKGEIFFEGNKINQISDDKKNDIRKEKISLIFQNNNLLNDFTAIENVAFPLVIKNYSKKNSYDKATKILSDFGLANRLNHFPDELSGGEQQRVAIARSLISETELILADEPTGNLDHQTTKEIFTYFLKLKKLKKTIIFATHNRDLANSADYKLSIFNGDIKRD
ncbi:MAG: ABC transporter ATP-binding protein [Pelagibacteraceae bacterium]